MFKFLSKTAQNIKNVLNNNDKFDKETLEEILIECDIDYDLVEKILENTSKIPTREQVEVAMHNLFRGETQNENLNLKQIDSKPLVELIIGVNGAGKTTTIAKLAKKYIDSGEKVILGAGDTFRAAACEQLSLWAKKLNIDIVTSQSGGDPSALAYDTIKAAMARNIDRVLIDTAGRLQNQTNLKKELEKIDRICLKALNGMEFRKFIVLDGTQGNQAVEQARIFGEVIKIDGAIVTKLDGTSKGGAIFSIYKDLKIPVVFIGVGEKENDLIEFNKEDFINGLLDSIFTKD